MFDVLGHSNKTQQLGSSERKADQIRGWGPNPRLGTESASGFGPGGAKSASGFCPTDQ